VRSASVAFGIVKALDEVSFTVNEGECIALVGPSGSGKTSLLRVLGASLLPRDGEILIDGTNPKSLPKRELRKLRGKLGFIHQGLDLVPVLRVVQNVLLGRVAFQSVLQTAKSIIRPSKLEVQEVFRILSQIGIESKIFERTDRLSGGEQQRVAVARALYQQSRVILADEPISSVDPTRGAAMVEQLIDLAHIHQTTCIVSLHNFELAKQLFPRLIGLRAGKVVFDRLAADVTAEDEDGLYQLPDGANQ